MSVLAHLQSARDHGRWQIHLKPVNAAGSEFAMSSPGDRYEREAERVAAEVLHQPAPRPQRACVCGGTCPRCNGEQHSSKVPQLKTSRANAETPAPSVSGSPQFDVLRGSGQPLDAATRAFMEPRFGHDFGHVRVHVGDEAAVSANALQAHAYTLGNRIVFGAGQYAPATTSGRRLLAHELTHVIQQGSTAPRAMREVDSAASEEQELAHGSEGMESGGSPVAVIERGGLRVSRDVTWSPAAATRNGCASPNDAAGRATFLQWDVNFSTSLRNGWLVQEIANTRTRTTCAGAAIAETMTPRYWEAWWVDGTGDVRIPTAINAARTAATASVAPAPADDLWRRASAAPSRGNMSIQARLYTCTRLPNGFAAGNVAAALDLPSTAVEPNAGDLGTAAASRGVTSQWNCCGPATTHFHNP